MKGYPTTSTIHRTTITNAQFSAQYRRARELAGTTYADKAIDVADATLEGVYEPAAARVAIGAYQWAASKLNPAEYGEHQRVDVAVTLADNLGDAPAWMRDRLNKQAQERSEVIDLEAEPILETASNEGSTGTAPPESE